MRLTRDLILASASPRRAALLRQLGIATFAVRSTDVDESFDPATDPTAVPALLAERKSVAAEAWLRGGANLALTADSVVVYDGAVLGKPADLAEARATLRRLCGAEHLVVTGFTLAWREASGALERVTRSVTTRVWLAGATEREIAHYLELSPPLDRAGAYGIQDWIGFAKATRIDGSYANVVGLPTAEVYAVLRERGFVEV